MPSYTFICRSCSHKFEAFLNFSQYDTYVPKCESCGKTTVDRSYSDDLTTISGGVIKGDSDLTLGDLANRNRDRMSNDHKEHLYHKHNEYKDPVFKKELPKGMSRLKKQKKIEWPK